jgi:hypothetical protein
VTRGNVTVDEHGRPVSAVPAGITDLAQVGADLTLPDEVEQRLQELWDQAADTEKLAAKYKLEVAFSEDRSMHRPYKGFLTAWTNGGFAHGGGDEGLYFCAGETREGKTCNAPLEHKWVGAKNAVCPFCKNVIDVKKLSGQIYGRLTSQNWAHLIVRGFHLLGGDADIRLGFYSGDLRRAAVLEQETELRGDRLNKLRLDRRWVLYPLKNIVKDTSAGASLYLRVRALLNA